MGKVERSHRGDGGCFDVGMSCVKSDGGCKGREKLSRESELLGLRHVASADPGWR
jgi:hypothetical protein